MADDLVISGGGSSVVATDEMLAEAEALARFAADIRWARSALAAIDASILRDQLVAIDAPMSAALAEEQLGLARDILLRCDGEAALLVVNLRASMELYGLGELFTEALARRLAETLGFGLGLLSPFIVAVALPALPAMAAGVLIRMMLEGEDLGGWLSANNELLTNPATVALIRSAVMSADDFLGGALRLPLPVVSALGDQGLGLVGLGTTAALAILMGNRAGLLLETPVEVTRTNQKPGTVARTMEERAARIPRPGLEANGEQIRIDRYTQEGQPDRFEIYAAGTADFAMTGAEPWNMTSNVTGVAGAEAGSYRAVELALIEAGVTADSPIVITGYSQGGLIASQLAASGDWNVQAVVTFGAPAGQVEIPPDVQVLTIRHSDDIVPATGGYDRNERALVVERHLFAGREVPDDVLLPAHHFPNYQETAALVDDAQSARLRGVLDDLASFGDGATSVETTIWRAERVQLATTDSGRGR